MNCPELKTNNYRLRAFETKDLNRFAQYRAQKSVAQYQSWSDYTYQDAVALFESTDYFRFAVVGQWYQLAIALQDSDELVGDLAVHFIDDEQVELGFTVAPDFQGQGVATEAASALLAYLFSELGKHRVVATTDANNVASYSVLEKLGFRREAHFIQNIFFKGAWGDEYQYALLSSESKFK
ncbi:GNAT family N-acetyltransferase [Vibrio hippocampi]|uniref:Ribosomal N-acetyltransferase YdaF n=1 Tax=Vibrio hippocampi TaxID=654686 RepID=A0ABN8DF67_9VIBR|nr:GNAT family protein [Vibrio hippocampi]CAH0525789.1 Putative ribosomal N-acetyltransferase YdaF [Vibrio hippocampi]